MAAWRSLGFFFQRAWLKFREPGLVRQAFLAIERGGLEEEILKEVWSSALAMTDINLRTYAPAFYLQLARRSGVEERIRPVVEKCSRQKRTAKYFSGE